MVSAITRLITFETVLLGILSIYGFTNGGGVDISNTLAQITGPWPVVQTAKCSFSAAGPTGSCNVLDFGILGAIWVFASIGSGAYRLGAALYLLVQLVGILNVITSVPFAGPVFLGFQIILGLYGWSMIRANHPPG